MFLVGPVRARAERKWPRHVSKKREREPAEDVSDRRVRPHTCKERIATPVIITIAGIGIGTMRFMAAAIPPRSAAASIVLPIITPPSAQ